MSGTWTALVADDWMRSGVKVLWRSNGDGPAIYSNGTVNQVAADSATAVDIEPLVMQEDMARSLLSALLRYYEGGEDTRSLRRDYDAERKRVDQFIAHLTRSAGAA